ncbi:heterokaryon incompatibility protein-domain-containing protein [Lyophyllum atratum]|nr:heterokaryon incompatibility protein-domain-containing protein [Lyophyllum atratum]
MFSRQKSSDAKEKKPSTLSRLFGRSSKSSSQAPSTPNANVGYQAGYSTGGKSHSQAHQSVQPAHSNNYGAGSTADTDSLFPPSVTETLRPPAPVPPPPAPATEAPTFNFKVTKDLWPEYAPGDDPMSAVGQLFFDFTDSNQKRWARGEDTGAQFGTSIFPIGDTPALPASPIPKRLFDLHLNRVVTTTPTDNIPYTIISHVHGENPVFLNGGQYGVEWQVPIRRKAKLDQMLTSARIIGGLRYVWIDVLCLDQRLRNEEEIAQMGGYYARARGCLVWLDNAGTTNASDWNKVLSAIEEVNKFFKMDRSGVSTISVAEMMSQGGFADLSLTGGESYTWIRKIVALETCPWFHRIWTLQEAVIPENSYFCTPERYMVGGAAVFQLIGLCGMLAKILTEMGDMTGVALTNELQKSEIWKTLRMRQLYRKRQIGYWHLFQATRNRTSKLEQDRVFGMAGLVHGGMPRIDYNRSKEDLYRDLFRASVEQRDFSSLRFLGDGETPVEPDPSCIPLITSPGAPVVQETHTISFTFTGRLELGNVGVDNVTRVYAIITHGSLCAWKNPEFLNLSTTEHIAIAKAFEMPPDTVGPSNLLVPAAFAAISAMGPLPPELVAAFGTEFQEKYEMHIAQGLLMWAKVGVLMQASEDNALVVIWTAASPDEPMLAVVNERVTGQPVFVVTPGSFVDAPGEGCLICVRNADGSARKIGLGVGRKVRAGGKATFVLT